MGKRFSPGSRHGGIDTGEGRRLVTEMQLGVHGVWTRPGRPAAQTILGEVVEGNEVQGSSSCSICRRTEAVRPFMNS